MFAFSPLARYACCRQRARIQTYAVIIATTLNTIRYSMCYLISSSALKSEASFSVDTTRSTQPGHGWPQRSQLQLRAFLLKSTSFSFAIGMWRAWTPRFYARRNDAHR